MADQADKRGRSYNADAARTAILNAAETIFAEHGFDGARVDIIAVQAGYNKSLLFQYFGDKLRLYAEVLKRADQEANELRTRIFTPLVENPTLTSNAHDLRVFFEQAFSALFDHLVAHPRLLRILLWEMAEGWQTYMQISQQAQVGDMNQLDRLFQEAQRAGLIRSSFIPAIQLTIALQTCQSYLASLPLFQVLLPDKDLTSSEALVHAREYIVGVIVAGIMVDHQSY